MVMVLVDPGSLWALNRVRIRNRWVLVLRVWHPRAWCVTAVVWVWGRCLVLVNLCGCLVLIRWWSVR